ncbi:MAG: L-histidine N(alpha)-methyltransferase, partial [Comamonadaceae bacterium]
MRNPAFTLDVAPSRPRSATSEFERDLLAGLAQAQRSVPPKYFY